MNNSDRVSLPFHLVADTDDDPSLTLDVIYEDDAPVVVLCIDDPCLDRDVETLLSLDEAESLAAALMLAVSRVRRETVSV